jgi:uncharacterized protein YqgV (UPF0045/DUF77 family)
MPAEGEATTNFFCADIPRSFIFIQEEDMKKYEASLAIQVLPGVSGNEEVIRVVDAVIAYIKGTGLNTFVGPFETTVEGDFDTLCEIAKQSQLICIREGAPSVATYMKMFFNPDKGVLTIDEKVSKHHA